RESVEFRHAHANGVSRNLGIVPSDRKEDGRRRQRAEIVAGVRVLPNVIPAHDGIAPERLLQASVELIAIARCVGFLHAWDKVRNNSEIAPFAGQDKIFIERTLQRSRIGNAQHRVGPLNVVSGSETRLGLTRNDQAVVQIAANSQVERPVSLGDRILQVKGQLFYIRMTAKWIQGTAGT